MAGKYNDIDALNALMPARQLRAVTPADGTDLPNGVCDALWIGTAGNVAVIAEDDTAAVTITSVPVGVLAVRSKRVMLTGTTASNIVAMY